MKEINKIINAVHKAVNKLKVFIIQFETLNSFFIVQGGLGNMNGGEFKTRLEVEEHKKTQQWLAPKSLKVTLTSSVFGI